MSYTVLWTPAAEDELTSIWLAVRDRRSIGTASRVADRLLKQDPRAQGESREGTTRIMFVWPLALQYKIREPDRVVNVVAVRLMKQRGAEP
jgi:plasmid stabilization system protein ParE